jgi:hypothetical protein
MEKKLVSVFILFLTTFLSYTVNAYENNPPNPPIIAGPSSGRIDVTYTYQITVSDPEEDTLWQLEVDFGNEIITEICAGCRDNPWNSGETVKITHKWTKSGIYMVKARVMDEYGLWSEWSDPLSVSMPKTKLLDLLFFRLFLEKQSFIFILQTLILHL